MNRNYRSYCRRMGEAMPLRHMIPRYILNDDELIRVRQTAMSTDLDVLQQTAVEMFPERFPDEVPQEEETVSQEQDQRHETFTSTMVCSY